MTALEQAIRSMIAEEVAAAEKRIREELGYQDRTLDIQEAATYISSPSKPVSTKTLYGMCERREILTVVWAVVSFSAPRLSTDGGGSRIGRIMPNGGNHHDRHQNRHPLDSPPDGGATPGTEATTMD